MLDATTTSPVNTGNSENHLPVNDHSFRLPPLDDTVKWLTFEPVTLEKDTSVLSSKEISVLSSSRKRCLQWIFDQTEPFV
ncbi:unnamed protein product [Trichobilharzia regenti]|nr:unnamed protein product [Trichobilharzia regenti]